MQYLQYLIRRLQIGTDLDTDDLVAINSLPIRIKEVPPDSVIVAEGESPSQCVIVFSGFVCRSKTVPSGRRQILSFHIAGDMPDLQGLYLEVMDHDLTSISTCKIGCVAHSAMRTLVRSRPNIAEALWRETLIDAAVFREWIVNVGARTAPGRMAHLISELRERLASVGLSADQEFVLPLTQADLADALGLTIVHVNRTLKALREDGLLDIRKGLVKLGDVEKLSELGEFDDLYLHQSRETVKVRPDA